MSRHDHDPELDRHAARWQERLARREERRQRRLARHQRGAPPAVGLAVGAGVATVMAFVTGHWWLLAIALVLLAGFAFQMASTYVFPSAAGDSAHGHIGMGATVAADAQVEPGAKIEMGATVLSGAVVKSGAVVGMGATVEANAVIESDAVVGWGATVRAGALVKRGAALGAGSVVERDAVVEENMRVGAGGVVATRRREGAPLPKPANNAAGTDPRDLRIDELCDRIEAELGKVSASLDEYLGNPRETVKTVRQTCHTLLKRERELRKEANPAEQERLNREAAALEERITAETDEVTREKLRGAVNAIAEHRRQRELLLRDANRLEAEQTRLLWTMEGLLAHVIRLRTTEETAPGSASAELDRALTQLRDEVSSVANAMEQVKALEVAGGPFETGAGSATKTDTRDATRS